MKKALTFEEINFLGIDSVLNEEGGNGKKMCNRKNVLLKKLTLWVKRGLRLLPKQAALAPQHWLTRNLETHFLFLLVGVCEQLETLKIVTLLGKTTDSVLNLSKNIISYVSHVLQLMPNTTIQWLEQVWLRSRTFIFYPFFLWAILHNF